MLEGEHPACPVERIRLDLADATERRALLTRLSSHASRVLVVTEGLLVYLDEATVASLAADLGKSFPMALWLLENVTPAVLARMKRNRDKTLRPADAEMKFAPADGLGFFRVHGWRPSVEKSLLDEAERLGREMRLVSAIRLLSRFIPPLQPNRIVGDATPSSGSTMADMYVSRRSGRTACDTKEPLAEFSTFCRERPPLYIDARTITARAG